jgi:hypothetical protein
LLPYAVCLVDERFLNGPLRFHSTGWLHIPRQHPFIRLGADMLKISLVAMFVAIMTTLAIAASALPVPPETMSNVAMSETV